MLFALIILLSQALAIQANFLAADKPGDDIEALCARKSIDLTTFEQLRTLEQKSYSSSCSDTTKVALGVLVHLIESGRQDLCSAESIESLRNFYAMYLDTSVEKNRDKLPKSLRRFVIAYGMEMSNLCKRNMIEILSQRGRELLSKEDFEQVEELTNDKGPVAEMLGTLLGADDLFTAEDLALFFKSSHRDGSASGKIGANDKIFIQSSTGPYVRKLQTVCERRFKPIYEPLMMPTSRLANMGFTYKDETLKGSLKSLDVAREVGQWSRIVFLCEALTMIHIVVDPADQNAAEGTEVSLVRIVTEAEAAAIEITSQESGTTKLMEIESADADLEMAVYLPEKKVLLGNEIYDRKNKELVAAVKSFKTSKTEGELFKRKLVKKGVSIMKQEVRQGHFKFLISAGYKGLLQHFKGDQTGTPSQELVKILNEMEANKGTEPSDGAISASSARSKIFQTICWIVFLAFLSYLAYLAICAIATALG